MKKVLLVGSPASVQHVRDTCGFTAAQFEDVFRLCLVDDVTKTTFTRVVGLANLMQPDFVLLIGQELARAAGLPAVGRRPRVFAGWGTCPARGRFPAFFKGLLQ